MTVATSVKFNFKTRTIKGDNGQVLSTIPKPDPVTMDLPYLTADEVIGALNSGDEKVVSTILDAVNELIKAQARAQFEELFENAGDAVVQPTAAHVDFDKLTLEYIANLEPNARGRTAISDEEYETFYRDYMTVMIAATGKDEKRIGKHVEFLKKPTRLKSDKAALVFMLEQLDIYLASTTMADDTGRAAAQRKALWGKWLKEEEKTVDLSGM